MQLRSLVSSISTSELWHIHITDTYDTCAYTHVPYSGPCNSILCGQVTGSGILSFNASTTIFAPVSRVIKTELEIAVLRYANEVSSLAHKEVMRAIRPGMTEFELESLFQHYCYAKGGCRHVAYTCILAR